MATWILDEESMVVPAGPVAAGAAVSASVPVLVALIAALLARGWLTALLFGLIGFVVSALAQPAVLGLVTGTPALALFGLVGLQRGFTPQVLATIIQFVAVTLLIYWAVRRRRSGARW